MPSHPSGRCQGSTPFFHVPPPPTLGPGHPGASALLQWVIWTFGQASEVAALRAGKRQGLLVSFEPPFPHFQCTEQPWVNQLALVFIHLLGGNLPMVIFF